MFEKIDVQNSHVYESNFSNKQYSHNVRQLFFSRSSLCPFFFFSGVNEKLLQTNCL